jgi:hypothetical protein
MASNDRTVIDASIQPWLWLLSCPVMHFGTCPYKTGALSMLRFFSSSCCGHQYLDKTHQIIFVLSPLVLVLEKDEVTKTAKSVCGWSEYQRTYAELGAVEKSLCCCFVCIDSSIGTIIPGWGCSTEAADAIAEELNSRVSARGDAAQLQASEETLQRIQAIESKLDTIMVHLANAPQPVSMDDRTAESHTRQAATSKREATMQRRLVRRLVVLATDT